MEEADKLIFQNLYSIGWELDDGTYPTTFKDVETSSIIKGLLLCLRIILEDTSLPSNLPDNMAQRFRIAADVSKEIKDLGYTGEIGYHSILYPNEVDLRKYFMFLIEKLPKYSQDHVEEPICTRDLIEQTAKNMIRDSLSKSFSSSSKIQIGNSHSYQDIMAISNIFHCATSFQHEAFNVNNGRDDFLKKQVNENISENSGLPTNSNEIQSILQNAMNSGSIIQYLNNKKHENKKGNICNQPSTVYGLPQLKDKPKNANIYSQEPAELIEKDSSFTILSILEEELASLDAAFNPILGNIAEKENNLAEIEQSIEIKLEQIKEEGENFANIKKVSSLGLLLDDTDNIAKLKTNFETLQAKEAKAQKQWMEFKEPLLAQISNLDSKINEKDKSKQGLKNEIFLIRKELKVLMSDATEQDALAVQLSEQVGKCSNGINRSVYTKRIIDISSKVRKLKEEINKILSDTRGLHKEINSLAGKLSRTFAVVEDSSFRVASSNENARQVYKCCLTIHEGCQRICQVVRDTGHAKREKADLLRKVDSAKAKNVEQNLKVLHEDFLKLKEENSLLKQQLLNRPHRVDYALSQT